MIHRFTTTFCSLFLLCIATSAFAQNINVTNNSDSGAGSLRDAIDTLNSTATPGNTVNIVLDPSLAGQTITLLSPFAPLNAGLNNTVNINSTNVAVTLNGNFTYRAFFLANSSQAPSNTTYTISSFSLINTQIAGGNGGFALQTGGGGAGLGGAVFADTGLNVNLVSMSFLNCAAQGGNSPASSGNGNGGGGGMGGNGGAAINSSGGGGGLGGTGGNGTTGSGIIGCGGGGGIRGGAATGNGANAPGGAGLVGGLPGVNGGSGAGGSNLGGANSGGGGSGNSSSGQEAGGGGGLGGLSAGSTTGGAGGYGGGGGGATQFSGGNGGFGGGGGGGSGINGGKGGGTGGFGGGGGGGDLGGGTGGFGGGAGGGVNSIAGFGGGTGSNTQGGGGLGAGGAIFIRQGTTLKVTDPTFTSGFLAAGGTGAGNGGAIGNGIFLGGTLEVNLSGTGVTEFAVLDFLGGKAGSPEAQGGLVKSGSGYLQLSSVNTYTGGTTINGGGILVNEVINVGVSCTGTGPVVVNSGGIFGGDSTGTQGSILGDVTLNNGGFVGPGDFGGYGILTMKGNVTFNNGSFLTVNIGGNSPGISYAQLRASGAIQLNGCDFIFGYLPFTPQLNDTYVIIDNQGAGPIQGEFNFLPEGYRFHNIFNSTFDGKVSYIGGDGNDFTLTIVAPPSSVSTLDNLVPDQGNLTPVFASGTLTYDLNLPIGTTSVSLTPTATDPDATITVDDAPTYSGMPSAPIVLSTGTNSFVVEVTAPNGVAKTQYTVNAIVPPDLPPVIPPLTSDNNPALINTLVSYTFTATDDVTPTLAYTFNFGDGSPDIVGSFSSGDSVTVTHTYTSYFDDGVFVSLSVEDENNPPTTVTTIQTIPSPSSTGTNIENVLLNSPPVVAPLDGLSLAVQASDGGVLQLAIDVSSLTRAAYSVSTDWGDTVGRTATVSGTQPVHQFLSRGLFVAKSTATNNSTHQQAGKARLTLALSAEETGDFPQHLRAAFTDRNIPRTKPNNDPGITTKSIKGKFNFAGTKFDTITYQGTVKLQPNVNPALPFEFWIAIGNIVVKSTIVKGKGTAFEPAGIVKSLKVTTKLKKGTVSIGGEPAAITATYSSKNTVANGFDTEGVSNQSTDVPNGKSAPRKIQIAMLLDGAPFQAVTPVDFKLTPKNDFGSISARKGN